MTPARDQYEYLKKLTGKYLTVGDPVAEVRRILCDPDDKIVYLADVTYRGDFIKLEMDLLA